MKSAYVVVAAVLIVGGVAGWRGFLGAQSSAVDSLGCRTVAAADGALGTCSDEAGSALAGEAAAARSTVLGVGAVALHVPGIRPESQVDGRRGGADSPAGATDFWVRVSDRHSFPAEVTATAALQPPSETEEPLRTRLRRFATEGEVLSQPTDSSLPAEIGRGLLNGAGRLAAGAGATALEMLEADLERVEHFRGDTEGVLGGAKGWVGHIVVDGGVATYELGESLVGLLLDPVGSVRDGYADLQTDTDHTVAVCAASDVTAHDCAMATVVGVGVASAKIAGAALGYRAMRPPRLRKKPTACETAPCPETILDGGWHPLPSDPRLVRLDRPKGGDGPEVTIGPTLELDHNGAFHRDPPDGRRPLEPGLRPEHVRVDGQRLTSLDGVMVFGNHGNRYRFRGMSNRHVAEVIANEAERSQGRIRYVVLDACLQRDRRHLLCGGSNAEALQEVLDETLEQAGSSHRVRVLAATRHGSIVVREGGGTTQDTFFGPRATQYSSDLTARRDPNNLLLYGTAGTTLPPLGGMAGYVGQGMWQELEAEAVAESYLEGLSPRDARNLRLRARAAHREALDSCRPRCGRAMRLVAEEVLARRAAMELGVPQEDLLLYPDVGIVEHNGTTYEVFEGEFQMSRP